ncbi:hypothetical protein OYT13_15780 [Pandoraea sp. XJJ-1]|uniref:hypothetical protein n=1 Tax=Pandoraea sp. XJJ-1 TaxID=3002643 RepID=UPI00228263DA|nr:hypothetical protein [Pandoraea sp. XJJ-1]WAL81311.1 hypothetical protein OYT13_15780 [Pandoraea sp. XJJ-1]
MSLFNLGGGDMGMSYGPTPTGLFSGLNQMANATPTPDLSASSGGDMNPMLAAMMMSYALSGGGQGAQPAQQAQFAQYADPQATLLPGPSTPNNALLGHVLMRGGY